MSASAPPPGSRVHGEGTAVPGVVRDAATVVLLRPQAPAQRATAPDPADAAATPSPTIPPTAIELFMVVRSAKSPFMPSALVFPGGRVDPNDGPAGSDAAFEAAARRETLEEIGLDLGARPLRWIDTWLTPSIEPRRYHTRFFAAALAPGEGAHAAADEHEVHGGRWAAIEAWLGAWLEGAVELPPPTIATLLALHAAFAADLGARDPAGAMRWTAAALGQRLDQLPWAADGGPPRTPIVPKWVYAPLAGEGDEPRHTIVLPHDPDYAALAGEAGPCPARAHGFAPRYIRRGATWQPHPRSVPWA